MPMTEVGRKLLALEAKLVEQFGMTKRGRIALRAMLEQRDVLLLAAARGHHLAEAYRVVDAAVDAGGYPDEVRAALKAHLETPLPVPRGRSYVMETAPEQDPPGNGDAG